MCYTARPSVCVSVLPVQKAEREREKPVLPSQSLLVSLQKMIFSSRDEMNLEI
jgi:hypothetical protein